MYACVPRESVIGSFTIGFMMVPLTVRGVMTDGRRLSGCSWSCCKRAVPATQMSAPESGRACTVACPFREDMCTLIVGADSNFSGGKSFAVAMNSVVETTRAPGRIGEGGFCGGSDERGIRRLGIPSRGGQLSCNGGM